MLFTKQTQRQSTYQSSATFSEGLKAHFMSVYNYMTTALGITGLVSFGLSKSSLIPLLFGNPILLIILFLAPIGLSFYMASRLQTLSLTGLSTCLMIYSGLLGISLAPIFLVYTGVSIAKTFFISASVFGLTSLYGYVTKRDLTSVGSFAFMGVIGIVLASVVNMFLKSSGLDFAISIIGVLCFTALAAWDTQKIKDMYLSASEVDRKSEMMQKLAIMSALSLYLDFINIFLFLLRFFGDRRSD